MSAVKTSENDVSVNIDGKTYYITPSVNENALNLQILADIVSAALIKLDSAEGAVYSLTKYVWEQITGQLLSIAVWQKTVTIVFSYV